MLFSKSNKFLISIMMLSTLLFVLPVQAQNNSLDFNLKSEAVILMDASSGKVIYEKNPHEKLSPASITKIMTMLLVMEAIENEKVEWTDTVRVSEHAASMGGSQIWLEPGEEMKVEELIKAVAVVSANDACVALAEYIAGTESNFIEQMNVRAEELGMENSKFYNTNGLPITDQKKKGNYTTAYDVALMTRALLDYPQILDYTSLWIDNLRDGDSFLRNTNKLVRFYDGADGVKTGYTNEAGFCLSATAKRKGLRFISVIMKAPSSQVRFEESKQLLSSAFNIYRSLTIVDAGEIVAKTKVFKGQEQEVAALAETDLTISILKGAEDNLSKKTILSQEVTAPIKAGDKLGEIKVFRDETEISKINLVAKNDVAQANYIKIITNLLTMFIENIMH